MSCSQKNTLKCRTSNHCFSGVYTRGRVRVMARVVLPSGRPGDYRAHAVLQRRSGGHYYISVLAYTRTGKVNNKIFSFLY